MQPLFITPIFKQMIWGGNGLRERFGYEIPGDDTGECWAISGHEKGDCKVYTKEAREFSGRTVSELWNGNKELWGKAGNSERFPLLVKFIDAKADLSIQVHPDDKYAAEHENGSLGKTECWYVLDAEEGATIVIGHNATTKEELEEMVREGKWGELIREIPVKKGDFFFIEPGTVHAIKGGTMILETQQSSDVTYRLYDYDRLQDGKPRELHIDKCLDVIRVPMSNREVRHRKVRVYSNGSYVRNLVNCKYFDLSLVRVEGELAMSQKEAFTLISVLDGEGTLNGCETKKVEIKKGENLILPNGFGDYELKGTLDLAVSYPM